MVEFGRDTVIRFFGGELIVRIDGVDEVRRDLNGIIARGSNLSRPFQVFQKYWFEALDEAFETATGPVPWPDLSPAYAAKKGAQYPVMAMQVTGTLRDSLTNKTSNTIWHVGARSIEFGTRVPHFIYHQEGLGNNPVRQTLFMPDSTLDKLVSLVTNYILTGRPE